MSPKPAAKEYPTLKDYIVVSNFELEAFEKRINELSAEMYEVTHTYAVPLGGGRIQHVAIMRATELGTGGSQ